MIKSLKELEELQVCSEKVVELDPDLITNEAIEQQQDEEKKVSFFIISVIIV